jgi:hypothetical protein
MEDRTNTRLQLYFTTWTVNWIDHIDAERAESAKINIRANSFTINSSATDTIIKAATAVCPAGTLCDKHGSQ